MSQPQPLPMPPFKAFLASNIPSVYDNTLTYYEELTKLIAYLEQMVVPQVNKNTADIAAYADGLKELKDYVDHYFDNLDVQEEINNKLDDMAEGGQLATIIAQFLAAAPVFGYNTIADMTAATNLNDGCIARVIGNSTASDGDGAYYLVRTRVEADDPDGFNLVAIGDSLVASRVQDAAINNLQEQVDALKTPSKKYLFVGDSYMTGYQGEGVPTVTGFATRVKNTLDLDATIVCANGYGFLGMSNVNKWQNLIENTVILNKDSYTDIIIAGGMNDQTTGLATQIDTTIEYLKANFTNAKIHIAMIGKYAGAGTNDVARIRFVYQEYKEAAARNNCKFIENAQFILHNIAWFTADNIHPNEAGQSNLALYFEEYISNGSINVFYGTEEVTISNSSNISSNFDMYNNLDNSTVRYLLKGAVSFVTPIATLSNLDTIDLGTLTSSYLCGSENDQGLHMECQGYVWSQATSKPYKVTISITNTSTNHLIATVFMVNDSGDTYTVSSVNELSIVSGWIADSVPAIYC